MREMSKSAVGVAREALAVGEASLPRYASKYSRRDGFTMPQLFACLAVRKFLGQDYRGMEALLGEWSELRAAIGLPRVPDHSTLCLAEAKLVCDDGEEKGGRRSRRCSPAASSGRARSGCSTPRRTPTPPPGRPRSTRPGWRRVTRRPTSAGGAGAAGTGT